jgi:pyruvate ferredoxin oxidoreductase gamma subunit/2-oxoisovalerate ferredoxin oxidoreductase gamma subunit
MGAQFEATLANQRLRDRLRAGLAVDVRGHGKAGGGLILAMQSFGAAIALDPDMDVQDWPLFSSARKGANVCAYMRIAVGRVEMTCQVTEPDIALLMNEASAKELDFAEGTTSGIYVVNTTDSPERIAERYRLGGTVATIAGDALGLQYLGRPLANVAVVAALAKATGLVDCGVAREAIRRSLTKRRIPERLVVANMDLYDAALDRVRTGEVPAGPGTVHARPRFKGYGQLPIAAQSELRTSHRNHTAGDGRPGVRIEFADPTSRCNGCSLCVGQCPEGIIEFTADPSRGAIVHGARFDNFCKACRECIAACPLHLFSEVAAVTRPEGAATES